MASPVLVTGANGLLGRAIVKRLALGRVVYAVVRNKPDEPFGEGVIAIEHDLRQYQAPSLTETPETIVHLAQSPRYRDFPEGAIDVFEVNVGSTQRLLDWASQNGVKRVVYASTGSVYGHGPNAFNESSPLPKAGGLSHYAASKRCGELLAESYRGCMTVIVLRFFTIYGPSQRSSMLVPRLIANVLQDRPIVLQGENGVRLNPVYIDDAAAATQAAIGLAASEVINVAGPEVLSLRQIGEAIGNATGRAPRFEVQSNTTPMHLVGGTAKMRRLLTSPQIEFAEGVMRVVKSDCAAKGLKNVVPN